MISWSEWQDLNLRPPASRTNTPPTKPLIYLEPTTQIGENKRRN
jgi:hypothetical protein